MKRWTRRARSLGSALLEVLQAELNALLEEIQATGRGWGRAVVYFVSAAAFAFWSVGVFTAFAIALLAEWWGVWKAAGVVFLVLLLIAAGLVFAGYRVFRRHRPPTVIVRGHLEDHMEWWRTNLSEQGGLPAGSEKRSKAGRFGPEEESHSTREADSPEADTPEPDSPKD